MTNQPYTLVVQAVANQRQAAKTAWRFACELINQQLPLAQIFFYGDGVLSTLASQAPADDEWHASEAFAKLAEQDVALLVCATAGQRLGVLDQHLASSEKKPCTLEQPYVMASLVDLTQAQLSGHKVIYFG